jgi:hypothetical protein
MNASTPPGEDGFADPGRRLSEEFRLLLDALAERAEPWLNQLATPPDETAGQQPNTCDWCPLCAAVALVRGEHSELAGRAAEHVLGLLALARAGLAAHARHQHAAQQHAGQQHAGQQHAGQPHGGGPGDAPAAPPVGDPATAPGEDAARAAGEETPAPRTTPPDEESERSPRVQRIVVHRRADATTGPAPPAPSETEC